MNKIDYLPIVREFDNRLRTKNILYKACSPQFLFTACRNNSRQTIAYCTRNEEGATKLIEKLVHLSECHPSCSASMEESNGNIFLKFGLTNNCLYIFNQEHEGLYSSVGMCFDLVIFDLVIFEPTSDITPIV